MARKRVSDKARAIIDAAIAVFAERGFWDTPTSLISKTAGVADGTLFNYFATKDDLINEVYLEIKRDLADHLAEGMAAQGSYQATLRYFWNGYIDWALENPQKFAVIQQIGSSYELSDEVRAAGKEPFVDLHEMARQSIAAGELCDYPVEFVGSLLEGFIVATIRYIAAHREGQEMYKQIGFDILWKGVVR
jgi:AcrR family transcriptional regulator